MTIESYDLDVCLVMNAVSNCPKGTPAKPAPPQNHTVPIPPALSASTGASAIAVVPTSPVASGTPAAPFSKSMAVTSTIPPGARSTSPASSTVQPYGCSMADATSLSANASGPSSVATDPAVISPGGHSIATTGSRCCDSGRAIYTDPVSGQTLCSCQYDMLSYQRLAAAGSLMAGPIGVYPESMSAYLSGISADQPPFYNPAGLDLKENLVGSGAPWPYPSVYHPYDTAFAGYPFSSYGIELNNSRRKNATRETTSTLKAWLNEHKKNPYPTKGEKIMLAIITKMTLTQVSTWFANARRRLKKENKMTWEPRNRVDDDDANVDDEEIKSTDDNDLLDTKDSGLGSSGDKDRSGRMGNLMDDRPGEGNNSEWSGSRPGSPNGSPDFFDRPSGVSGSGNALFHPAALHHNFRPAAGSPPDITSYHQQQQILHHHQQTQQQIIHATVGNTAARLSVKPRIWSLADMAKDGKDSPQKENPLGHELPSSHDTLYVHAVQHPSPGKIMPPIAARIPNYSPYMRPELYRSFYGTSTAAHMTVQTQEFLEHQRTFGASLAVNNSLSMNPLLWKAAVSSCGGTPLTPLSLTTNNQQQHHLAPPPGISPSASSTSSSVGCDVVQTIPTSGTLQHQIAQISGHSTSSSASSNSGNLSPGINVTSFNAKP